MADKGFIVEIILESMTKSEIEALMNQGAKKELEFTSGFRLVLQGIQTIKSLEVEVWENQQKIATFLFSKMNFGIFSR